MPSSRSVRKILTAISPRFATSTLVKGAMLSAYSPPWMTVPDQLTLARALAVPVVVVLFAWNFPNHDYWATAVFVVAMSTDQIDGWLARRWNQTSAFGSLLDPIADKVLVMSALVKLKTWAQAIAVAVGGMAAAGAWSSDVAWWVLLIAVVLTWISGLDYARVAPRVLRTE